MGVWRFVDRYRSRPASYLVYGGPPGRPLGPPAHRGPAFAADKATPLRGWPFRRACAAGGGRGWGLVVPPRLARTAHHPVWPHWPTQCVGHASEDAGAPFGCMLVPRPCTRLAGGHRNPLKWGRRWCPR
jgi:hypothetical protein